MKDITIGVFFGTILHENMGCNALNYSFLQICKEIGDVKQWNIHYIFYWDIPQTFNKDNLPIELKQYDINFMKFPDSYIKLFAKGILKDRMRDFNAFFNSIKKCDLFVDTCGGDSFSDIYGPYTLRYISICHRTAHFFKKPIVLLPQTIGPFNTKKGNKISHFLLKKARSIFVRDLISYNVALCSAKKEKIIQTIDMAFHMDYEKRDKIKSERYAIGISPSALLWNGGYTGKNELGLREDYKKVIRSIISFLQEQNCDIYLLAHVLYGSASKPREDDYWLCKQLHREYPSTILAPFFYTPMEAKSFISSLDGLMSSRMHCCIGAYSACIPTFTLGYSRKFNGLFKETLNYNFGTDLKIDSLKETILKLEFFISNIPSIKEEMPIRKKTLILEKEKFIKSLSYTIESCIEK